MCFFVLPNDYIEIHFTGIAPKPEHPFNMFELVGQTSKMFIVWLKQIGYFLNVYIFVFIGKQETLRDGASVLGFGNSYYTQ